MWFRNLTFLLYCRKPALHILYKNLIRGLLIFVCFSALNVKSSESQCSVAPTDRRSFYFYLPVRNLAFGFMFYKHFIHIYRRFQSTVTQMASGVHSSSRSPVLFCITYF